MRIAVVGAGTMGHGIALVFAAAGHEVFLVDVSESILESALARIRDALGLLNRRGLLKEDINAVMSRIRTTVSLADAVKDSDLVIEAVPEDANLKRAIFREVDEHAPPKAILASNTSTIPITELAEATGRPGKVVGMHFMNPPYLMRLVELVKGKYTDEETLRFAEDVVKGLGKEAIVVRRDVPGFVVNRVLFRVLVEACREVDQEGLRIIKVDGAARNILGLPMGPFELMDYIGLDVSQAIIRSMQERGVNIHDCPLLRELVSGGKLGVKSGEGFYKYPKPGQYSRPQIPPDSGLGLDAVRLIAPAINEAAWLVREGVASIDDVEKGVKLGLNYPWGILEAADLIGLDNVVEVLKGLKENSGWGEYEPDPLLADYVKAGRLGRKVGKGFREYAITEVKYSEVLLRVDPPMAWIILNRPDKLNAITPKMAEEVMDALRRIEANDNVKVVVFMGNGRAFSAGADVNYFLGSQPEVAKALEAYQRMVLEVSQHPKPTIAAVSGYALGGGLELALACDIRILADDAVLGFPEVDLGLAPGAGGLQMLPRVIGLGLAKELIMLGMRIGARRAKELGLATRVVPKYALEFEARRIAKELASKPQQALAAVKKALNKIHGAITQTGFFTETETFMQLLLTSEAQERIRRFTKA